MPQVTVVIPAYNAEQYIGETLASVHEQTLRDVEVLVVDDGSTDATLTEVERFIGKLNLTIVRQANAGPSAARNNGIRRARGDFCALLDADDVMLPELLATQMAFLEADPDLGFVLTNVMTFDERGIIHPRRWNFARHGDETVLDRLLLDNFVTTSAVMAPTRRLLEAGLFSEDRDVAEDYELWLRMAARWKVGIVDRPLVRYRYRYGSLSHNKLFSSRSALEVIEAFWQKHPDYLRRHPQVYRRSLGRHLANAGGAARAEGRRGVALAYIVKSLAHAPSELTAWKELVKTLLPLRRVPVGHRAPSARVPECTGRSDDH
jgi:glycosyltransferase involved in cell wall biosynthesis